MGWIIGIIVLVAIGIAVAGIYNNMVTLRNRIDNAWQNIDTQLQRRNDLIPNLVETVKGYAAHEKEALGAVVSARNAAVSASSPDDKIAADNILSGANQLPYARHSYNDCVLNYNNAIQTFPGNIFAGVFQFKERSGFEAAEAAREAPKVKF